MERSARVGMNKKSVGRLLADAVVRGVGSGCFAASARRSEEFAPCNIIFKYIKHNAPSMRPKNRFVCWCLAFTQSNLKRA